ncbi:unnamed protein product, partial [Hapterophycus canaliculatus]
MPDDGNNKRMRMSPPDSPNIDSMEVMSTAVANEERPRGASDASSDWDDWADAMVSQGEPVSEATDAAPAGEAGAGSTADSPKGEDDQWAQTMMDQGTLGSVVEGVESRAWDYVLQMVVDDGEQSSGATTVASPAQEVRGAAATEFVSRWLRHNLPVARPALNLLALMTTGCSQHQLRRGSSDGQHRRVAQRILVDSVVQPSAVAVVSCSPEQRMHRANLFSLSGNAGAALAAAVVQPGAAGLDVPETGWHEEAEEETHNNGSSGRSSIGELAERGRPRAGRRNRGVVFQALDSRILEDALVSAMGRLGLGLRCRSRSGMWKLRQGVVLPAAGVPAPSKGQATPLNPDDAGFIARCYSRCSLHGSVGDSTPAAIADVEAVVRGLIIRNPSAGIRRRNHLVAWCLSFDCGLAGALYVVPSTHGTPVPGLPPVAVPSSTRGHQADAAREGDDDGDYFSPHNLVLALLAPLLTQSSGMECSAADANIARKTSAALGGSQGGGEAVHAEQHHLSPAGSAVASEKTDHISSSSSGGGVGLDGLVLDDDSPFVGLFRELELLERVCDADWVRFEPFAGSGSGRAAATLV